jgi:glycosyltransferase involved in cell wall biosynthesis
MKILVLNYEYPPIGGGAGTQTRILNECLTKIGYKVVLITSHYKGLPFIEIKDNYTIIRIPVFRSSKSKGSFIQMLLYDFFALPVSLIVILFFKINLVHAHFILPCGIIAYFIKIVFNLPYVVTAHGGDVPSHQKEQTSHLFTVFKGLAQRVLNNSDKIHSVSKELSYKLNNDFIIAREKLITIPNSIDFKKIAKEKQKILSFAYLGRISKEKNLDFVIDCLNEFKHPFVFYIIGAGDDSGLKDRIQSSNLKKKVFITGWLEKRECSEYLSKADYLILHSSAEGLSMAGLEANMYGLPIIASDIPALKIYVKDGINGFCSPLKNKAEFLNLLYQLQTFDKYYELSRSSQLYVKKNFNIAENVASFVKIFTEIYSSKEKQ